MWTNSGLLHWLQAGSLVSVCQVKSAGTEVRKYAVLCFHVSYVNAVVSVRHRDVLNWTEQIFARQTFLESVWIDFDGSHLCFLLILKKLFLKRKVNVKICLFASSRGQSKVTYFMYFPWPPLEEEPSISTFYVLFTGARKLLLLIHTLFLGAFAKLRKVTISFVVSVRLFTCLSAWNNSATTGRVLMRRDTWVCFKNLSRKFKLHLNLTRITVTVREDVFTFMTISR